jgi:hypothetical protein
MTCAPPCTQERRVKPTFTLDRESFPMFKCKSLVSGFSFALLAATGLVLRADVVLAHQAAQKKAGAEVEAVVAAAN